LHTKKSKSNNQKITKWKQLCTKTFLHLFHRYLSQVSTNDARFLNNKTYMILWYNVKDKISWNEVWRSQCWQPQNAHKEKKTLGKTEHPKSSICIAFLSSQDNLKKPKLGKKLCGIRNSPHLKLQHYFVVQIAFVLSQFHLELMRKILFLRHMTYSLQVFQLMIGPFITHNAFASHPFFLASDNLIRRLSWIFIHWEESYMFFHLYIRGLYNFSSIHKRVMTHNVTLKTYTQKVMFYIQFKLVHCCESSKCLWVWIIRNKLDKLYRKVLEVLFFRFYVHFIGKRC
jgi:hypothetical protein